MPAPKTIHEFRAAILSPSGPDAALARLVAIALTMDMNSRSLESFAGAERIAERAGLSERATRTYLTELVRQGWIVERTRGRGRNYWAKIRRANIPESYALPAPRAGSPQRVDESLPACGAGSQAETTRLPEPPAGLPARDDTTACTGAFGDPARRAGDLDSDLGNYLDLDLARARALRDRRRARPEPRPLDHADLAKAVAKAAQELPDYSDEDLAKILHVQPSDIAEVRIAKAAAGEPR
jgi:hypothetical protein